ncbi:uncharacterized protein LOC135479445 [Liolophura sinensis]|uniref:uncharacterized protein LOC135479445 n=1 Tax=Liolophura sinensis TaxID=3198878 RepID=UPI0031598063
MGNSDSQPPIPPGSTVTMWPSQILFTHDSISPNFQDGRCLTETYDDIVYKRLDPSTRSIHPLVVTYHNGKWWVIRGNRRLYLYKDLEKRRFVREVLVTTELFDEALYNRQFSSRTHGASARVRGAPNFDRELDRIIQKWNRENGGCAIM